MSGRGVVPAALGAALFCVASPSAEAREPARMQVSAKEFGLVLSRSTVPAGPAIVALVNFGEDDHDLALRRVATGAPILRIRTVEPGQFRERRLRLAKGRYRLWCTIADHRALGMRATLRVRPRRTS